MKTENNTFPIQEVRKKLAQLMVKGYMQTEEYKKEKEMWDKELEQLILHGTPTTHFNDKLITEIINYGK